MTAHRTFLLTILAMSVCFATLTVSAQEWGGIYRYNANLGRTAGGTSVNITYEIAIEDGPDPGAEISAESPSNTPSTPPSTIPSTGFFILMASTSLLRGWRSFCTNDAEALPAQCVIAAR